MATQSNSNQDGLRKCLNYANCGVEFIPTTEESKFCSVHCCYSFAARKKREETKQEKKQMETCKTCGAEFEVFSTGMTVCPVCTMKNMFNGDQAFEQDFFWRFANAREQGFRNAQREREKRYEHAKNYGFKQEQFRGYRGPFREFHEYQSGPTESAQVNSGRVSISLDLLNKIIGLCHPDKHGNSQRSNEVTAELLKLKKEIK